jgi:branched-chain amino acid transport system ATP-binding protein
MLLKLQGLGISFGGLRAVDNVDFEVPEGIVSAIIGPNGAGKSTLFNLISGVYRPDSGKIFLSGNEVTGLPPHRMAALGVGRTFQATHLFPQDTAIDNVLAGRRLRTRSNLVDAVFRTPRHHREERESRELAVAALRRVGAEDLAHRPVGGLTQEARKQVAIALALATEPRLLLLDEPAAGLNAPETQRLADLIRRIVDDGVTVCLVEHKMRMVMSLADRILVLHHGAKVAEGTPKEIVDNPRVVEVYLGGGVHA